MQFYVTVTLEPIITRRWSCFVGGQVQEKYLPLFSPSLQLLLLVFGYYSWFMYCCSRALAKTHHVCEHRCVWNNKKHSLVDCSKRIMQNTQSLKKVLSRLHEEMRCQRCWGEYKKCLDKDDITVRIYIKSLKNIVDI